MVNKIQLNCFISIIAGKIKPTSMALSLIKGFEIAEGGGIELISQVISRHLHVSNESFHIAQNTVEICFTCRFHVLF